MCLFIVVIGGRYVVVFCDRCCSVWGRSFFGFRIFKVEVRLMERVIGSNFCDKFFIVRFGVVLVFRVVLVFFIFLGSFLGAVIGEVVNNDLGVRGV